MSSVKFNLKNKGTIGQRFGGNPTMYAGRSIGHSGIDSIKGWGATIYADNAGYVYKTINSNQSKENWQGVYMLVPIFDDFYMEICQGHFSEILVKAGEPVLEGQPIGLEGNKGYVFFNTKQITPEMQRAGDRRGAHTHTSFRPVERVKDIKKGEYYLQTVTGEKFKDKEGAYYRILHKDNGYNGNIDPMQYAYTPNVEKQKKLIGVLQTLVATLTKAVNLKKK